MKIFLDDDAEYRHPDNDTWTRAFTVEQAKDLFLKNPDDVDYLSLDNDLGFEEEGKDFLNWLEYEYHSGTFVNFPMVRIHSANVSARDRMAATLNSIEKYTIYCKKCPTSFSSIAWGNCPKCGEGYEDWSGTSILQSGNEDS